MLDTSSAARVGLNTGAEKEDKVSVADMVAHRSNDADRGKATWRIPIGVAESVPIAGPRCVPVKETGWGAAVRVAAGAWGWDPRVDDRVWGVDRATKA